MSFIKKYNNWLNMYIQYSKRHYRQRWEILKRENFMEYYDPWDWNVPTEDTDPAYWTFRKKVLEKKVKKKHIVNMLTLHKYRNAFRSWIPFYHSWIEPFDRRWAVQTNKWPSNVNIYTLKVNQGLRPGHTNLTYIREYLLFNVKPFLNKQYVKSTINKFANMKGITKLLLSSHTDHNNHLIYKNFHKKRLKKKYEYIRALTIFDYKQMQSYYDRWYFNDWFNLMDWTSSRLKFKHYHPLAFQEHSNTFNKIANLLEILLLFFNLKSQQTILNKKHNKSILESFEQPILNAFRKSLKQVIKIINMNFTQNLKIKRKLKQRNKKNYNSDLYLNYNNIVNSKKNPNKLHLFQLKKMFQFSFKKEKLISFLQNTSQLTFLLNYLNKFLLSLYHQIKWKKKSIFFRKKREKKRRKRKMLPYYEKRRRNIKYFVPIISSIKFTFHKLDYRRKINYFFQVYNLFNVISAFKKLILILRKTTVQTHLSFIKITKKRLIHSVRLLNLKKKKNNHKIKQASLLNKTSFFAREHNINIKNQSWRDPLFRLTGNFGLDVNNLQSNNIKTSPLTLHFFNKLMQLQKIKSLKQFTTQTRKILTYYRHSELKIATDAKSWENLVKILNTRANIYYPYYLRIYSWLYLPQEMWTKKNNKKPFLLMSGPPSAVHKSLILSMRFKRKNLYFTLTDFLGKVLVSISAASQGISKGRYFSAHLLRPMYNKLFKCFRKYKVTSYFFKVTTKFKGIFKYLRVYLRNRNILLRGLLENIKRPHNGMRRRKTRRL